MTYTEVLVFRVLHRATSFSHSQTISRLLLCLVYIGHDTAQFSHTLHNTTTKTYD